MARKSEQAKANARAYAAARYRRPGVKERSNELRRLRDQTPEGKAKKAEASKRYYAKEPARQRRAEKQRERQLARLATPEGRAQHRMYCRRWHLRVTFGISIEEYDAILASQGGVCAICLQPPDRGRIRAHVDHDHATNRVRGILCGPCNQAIGLLKESVESIQRAADYLKRSA